MNDCLECLPGFIRNPILGTCVQPFEGCRIPIKIQLLEFPDNELLIDSETGEYYCPECAEFYSSSTDEEGRCVPCNSINEYCIDCTTETCTECNCDYGYVLNDESFCQVKGMPYCVF